MDIKQYKKRNIIFNSLIIILPIILIIISLIPFFNNYLEEYYTGTQILLAIFYLYLFFLILFSLLILRINNILQISFFIIPTLIICLNMGLIFSPIILLLVNYFICKKNLDSIADKKIDNLKNVENLSILFESTTERNFEDDLNFFEKIDTNIIKSKIHLKYINSSIKMIIDDLLISEDSKYIFLKGKGIRQIIAIYPNYYKSYSIRYGSNLLLSSETQIINKISKMI